MRARVLLFLLLFSSFTAQAQRPFRVLHAFGNGSDGAGVYGSVILDSAGSVYGTTSGGGAYDGGTVFRLRAGAAGAWVEDILHSFGEGNDGAMPLDGPVLDSRGSLYGTTEGGGGSYTYGTVFRLSPGRGGWKEAVLHRFGQHDQDSSPWGSVVMDQQGDVYGTAASAAFELTPGPKGWKETILHNFTGKSGDGAAPFAGPIRDAAGNLYGTTMHGGGGTECGAGCGTVWELSPPSWNTQGWTEHILHAFGVTKGDGGFPGLGQLTLDALGNLYGTTESGGPLLAGTVFKLTPPASDTGGEWRETILHGFGEDQDGYLPEGGVILDNSGNLYGTTGTGGAGCGVVFKLSPQGNGTWKYALLHTFHNSDGCAPDANLAFGPDGKLYGTTSIGGTYGGGVVFQLTP
jgi:uncharacterized repeat protein (TIGR03803 family)